MIQILSYRGFKPKVGSGVFIGSGSFIIGQVEISLCVSIWYNCVLRGDVGRIFIGKLSNIQDGTVIHVDRNDNGDTVIGEGVTVGHKCLLHACTLHDYSFVGMGAIVMDGAIIESESMVAAGALVTRGKIIKSGELWAGAPAKFVRNLSSEEINFIKQSAINYDQLRREYLEN